MSAEKVSVLLVDDEELVRTGLRALLSQRPGITVVGEAADGGEVVPLVEELRPDVVLMDIRMPGTDGIRATEQVLASVEPPPKVIVLTTFDSDEYVYDALRVGASGFLLKRAKADEIVHALRVVVSGDSVLFPQAVRRMAATGGRTRPDRAGGWGLTGREVDVLRLMAAGLSNQDIAGALFISLETVKTHVGNVLTKLAAANRTQAVVLAYESGIVVPGERVV